MRLHRALVAAAWLAAALYPRLPAIAVPSASERASAADAYLTRAAALGRFNGAALIAIDGRVVLEKGYGFADFQRRLPNTPETQFQIASISKMFTAFAIVRLRDGGALSLSDPICRYLQPCPASWSAVTIDEVIHHRSGIPDYEDSLGLGSPAYLDFMTKPGSGLRILDREERLPLDFPPGSKFNYSNTAYVALSVVAERAAHEPFGKLLHRLILSPAGMTRTGVLGEDLEPTAALGYRDLNPPWERRVPGFDLAAASPQPFPALSLEPPHGDAQLFSTVGDLYRWSVLAQGSAVVPPAEADLIFAPQEGYGFGWFIDKQFGTTVFSHTGELPGYLGLIEVVPERHVTVIFLDNYLGSTGQVFRDLPAIALGEPYDMPFSGEVRQLSVDEAAPFLGTYRLADGDVVTVGRGKTVPLVVRNPNKYTFGLIALGADRFYLPLHDGVVTFADFDSGLPRRINLHYDGVDRVGVRTVRP